MVGGGRMANETEKITINIGVVELAQIDVLVEQGIYSNRSDFIRTSIRKNLEVNNEIIKQHLEPISNKENWNKTIGILLLSKKNLEELARNGEKLNISIIGMLVIDTSVSAELFQNTVDNILVRGKLVASDEIKEIIKSKI